MQIVRPHDVQGVVITWLTDHLHLVGRADVVVDSWIHNPTPDVFVRVVRTGGLEADIVSDDASIELESYVKGTSDAAAFLLDADVRGLLVAMDGETVAGAFVRSVNVASGPANLPNPTVPQHQRVRRLYEISTRMRVTDLP